MKILIYSANNYPGFIKGNYAANFGNYIASYWDISKLKARDRFHNKWITDESIKKQRSFIMVSALNNGFIRDIQIFRETPTLSDIKRDMQDMYPPVTIGDQGDTIIIGHRYRIVQDNCGHGIPIGTIVTITSNRGDLRYYQDYNSCYVRDIDIQKV